MDMGKFLGETGTQSVLDLIKAAASRGVFYGVCTTGAGENVKEIQCPGFALAGGAAITIKFDVGNAADNMALNVNGTGAKPVFYKGVPIDKSLIASGTTYEFRYNGTQYDMVGDPVKLYNCFQDKPKLDGAMSEYAVRNISPWTLFQGALKFGQKEFPLSTDITTNMKLSNGSFALECAGYTVEVPGSGVFVRVRGYYFEAKAFVEEIYLIAPRDREAEFGGQKVAIGCDGYFFNNSFQIYPNGDKGCGHISGWYDGGARSLYIDMSYANGITVTKIELL